MALGGQSDWRPADGADAKAQSKSQYTLFHWRFLAVDSTEPNSLLLLFGHLRNGFADQRCKWIQFEEAYELLDRGIFSLTPVFHARQFQQNGLGPSILANTDLCDEVARTFVSKYFTVSRKYVFHQRA